MSTPLLPQSFWFRLSIPCRRVDAVPRAEGKRLLDLPESCRLPRASALEGREPWAEVRVAWNPRGLAVAVEAEAGLDTLKDDFHPEGQNGVQIWVDSRDTRDVSRATRFCHRFDARIARAVGKTNLGVTFTQRDIPRAVANAKLCDPDTLQARAERLKKGWRLELFVPAQAIQGYDPETNRRLGFAYQVSGEDRADEFLSAGREFPVGENPSLWSTLELTDAH